MSRFMSTLVLVVAMIFAGVASSVAAPSESDLKARFSERHGVLVRLKDAGKIGETSKGLVGVVKSSAAKDSVDLPAGKTTVADLVRAENADRKQLYALIAERTKETAAAVADQAAIRNFRTAKPEHNLQLANGKWVKKKDLPPPK